MSDYWIRRSPFYDATVRAGCRSYSFANHMYQPGAYADPLEEYWKLVTDVTLWDVGTERQVEVAGPDAAAFCDRLTTRDVHRIPVGRCRYAPVTAPDGGIVNDPVLLRLAPDRFWFSTSDSDLLLWAMGVAVGAGLDVTIGEPDVSPLQVQGPKATAVIDALFGGRIVLDRYELRETELDGIPLVVTRTGWSGEVGYELFLRDGRYGDDLWERVLAAGAPHGIAVTGPSDINRVEAGILGYRCDIDLTTNPFEVGLGRLVELDGTGDFIGRAALERVAAEGVRRRLVGIVLDVDDLPVPFHRRWPVRAGSAEAGYATVAVRSPRLARTIGYAMVAAGHAAAGTRLVVAAPWGEVPATVVPLPFIARR